uniref:Ig-like domain-containing protein n=1 Tax=Scleropages formosus TaxID=113540 RepID=A0A8C9R4Y0_SCLFO
MIVFTTVLLIGLIFDADKVKQEPFIYFLEGDKALTYYNIHWYRQYPGTAPQFILFSGSNSYSAEFAKERFSSSADKSSGEASLSISRVQLEDSAVYYCALETTVMNLHQHSYKNLLHLMSVKDKHSVSLMRK